MASSDEFYDYENSFLLVTDPVPILQQQISKDVTTNAFLTGINKPLYKIKSGKKLNNFGKELNKEILNEIVSKVEEQTENSNKQSVKQHDKKEEQNKSNQQSDNITNISEINVNLSIYIIEVMDELLNKPEDIEWKYYMQDIFREKQKLVYTGIFILIIVLLLSIM